MEENKPQAHDDVCIIDLEFQKMVIERIIRPGLLDEIQTETADKKYWTRMETACLSFSYIFAGLSAFFAFASGYFNVSWISYVAGSLSVIGIMLARFASYAHSQIAVQVGALNNNLESLGLKHWSSQIPPRPGPLKKNPASNNTRDTIESPASIQKALTGRRTPAATTTRRFPATSAPSPLRARSARFTPVTSPAFVSSPPPVQKRSWLMKIVIWVLALCAISLIGYWGYTAYKHLPFQPLKDLQMVIATTRPLLPRPTHNSTTLQSQPARGIAAPQAAARRIVAVAPPPPISVVPESPESDGDITCLDDEDTETEIDERNLCEDQERPETDNENDEEEKQVQEKVQEKEAKETKQEQQQQPIIQIPTVNNDRQRLASHNQPSPARRMVNWLLYPYV